MPVAKMLVDSTTNYEFLIMLDVYSRYNQIFIVEDDMPNTTFKCIEELGTYKWIVTPFG